MDDRTRQNRCALSAAIGVFSLTAIILIAGKMGFGKPEAIAAKAYAAPKMHNRAGAELSRFDRNGLYTYLTDRNFNIPASARLHEIRRMYLAYHYQALFDSVSVRTSIPAPVLFAFFIIEATREGIESPLFSDTWNPGGIKYRGRFSPYYSFDDCHENGKPVKCAFEHPGNFDNAALLWSDVFNQKRYKPCKNLSNLETCRCLQISGYHTAKNYRQRARIADSYPAYQKMFPDARR